MECLTEFIGLKLEDFYDQNFVPKYKVGDIIEAKIPKTNRRYAYNDEDFITVKVRIENVFENEPYRPYRAVEIERKIHWYDPKIENDTTYIDYINDLKDKVHYDDHYLCLNNNLEFVI